MEIAAVETIVVEAAVRDRLAADQTHEAALVRITSDSGVVGVGEAAAAPRVVQAFLTEPTSFAWSRSVADLLLGEDPRDPRRLWSKLVAGTVWSGRVGLGHVALAGVDMALWDLAGKLAGQPVWQLLGGAGAERPVPYLTLYTGPAGLRSAIRSTLALLDRGVEAGYRVAKIEALDDVAADSAEIVELVRAVRRGAGDDIRLALDVGYRWRSADEALDCLRQLEDVGLEFVETPLMPDLLDEYRRLADASPVPVAAAEILTAHAEFEPLLAAGVHIVQPGTCRLGVTECDRLARTAAARGRQLVPYGYVATLFSTAANLHVAAANANVPLVEMAPPSIYPHMTLRAELAGPEPVVRDGSIDRPTRPGLGVDLDEDALERYRVG